ncbi:MAG: adenylate/guanylate cyclase domain-containing protein [Dehalococcoidia bacterium]
MEPRTQYAQTADGVSIAFWMVGDGPPLVYISNVIWSHAQLEWQFPEIRRWYERLAESRTLVRFDPRGTGLSERVVDGFSLETLHMDLQAVVERAGLERFALFAAINAAPLAISYAARCPERVSHLILWCYAPNLDIPGSRYGSLRALQQTMDRDWETYTEARAAFEFGWTDGDLAHRYAALLRECIAPEMAPRAYEMTERFDVTSLLPEVVAPTLVLHRQQLYFWDVEASRSVASRIPDARLTVLGGVSAAPFHGDVESVRGAIEEFLGADETGQRAGIHGGGLVTILFTDMESSTALGQRLGDAKTQDVRRVHNTVVRDALKAHGGSEVKHTGDGIMASFATASSALNCAAAIQRGVAAHIDSHPESPLGVYIGLNAGEPIAEERDLFGTSVDLARRICDHAAPGQIVASNVVRELVEGKGFAFSDIGEVPLKGFDRALRLFELRWRD